MSINLGLPPDANAIVEPPDPPSPPLTTADRQADALERIASALEALLSQARL